MTVTEINVVSVLQTITEIREVTEKKIYAVTVEGYYRPDTTNHMTWKVHGAERIFREETYHQCP
eukprot:TRINITY_DN11861_c0_g1_i1.p3 TRINITY_DN11861_c0_g1~~TRINITY_DN11861_c0_g1_i1.p3  ORF type:complete len:64 (-),score=7.03 TRINITY_DN11861_c0_g1_i1:116-307(-)